MINSLSSCITTGISALTNLFKTVDNLTATAEAHSAAYKAEALLNLQAQRKETPKEA